MSAVRIDTWRINRAWPTLRSELASGAPLDAVGARLTPEDWVRVVDELPRDGTGRPLLSGDFSEATFLGGCSLTGLSIRGARFNGATFDGGADFRDCLIGSRVRFIGVRFVDPVVFDRTKFGDRITFEKAEFADRSRIANAKFGNSPSFHNARFGDGCSFRGTKFAYRPKFRAARFGADAQFANARFGARAEFQGAHFGANARFVAAEVGAGADFRGAGFGDRAQFIAARFAAGCEMRGVRFAGDVTFQRASFSGDVTLAYSTFRGGADFGRVDVAGALELVDSRFLLADRLGPIHCGARADLTRTLFAADVIIEIESPCLCLSEARLTGGARVLASGEVKLRAASLGPRCELVGLGGSARLLSVEAADVGGLAVSGLDVRSCLFADAQHLQRMRLESGAEFEAVPASPLATVRAAIAEEHLWRLGRDDGAEARGWYPPGCRQSDGSVRAAPPSREEIARCYRALRQGREEVANAPGASDFYYGEMEMRRLSPHPDDGTWRSWIDWLAERFLLTAYWAASGYGTRAARSLLLLFASVLLAAMVVDHCDLASHVVPGGEERPLSYLESLLFVCRSALLLPQQQDTAFTIGGNAMQIAFRIVGPVLLGLAAFSMRARVKR